MSFRLAVCAEHTNTRFRAETCRASASRVEPNYVAVHHGSRLESSVTFISMLDCGSNALGSLHYLACGRIISVVVGFGGLLVDIDDDLALDGKLLCATSSFD